MAKQNGVPTVGEVIQEHIDLLVRPSAGTVRTYQTMLNLHIRNVLGSAKSYGRSNALIDGAFYGQVVSS